MNESTNSFAPFLLGENQPAARPYHGGAGIARFRGTTPRDDRRPEDFIGSTTEVFAGGGAGLTTLDGGRTLREAITTDPVGYLGEHHVARYGADTRLLVKMLDTGERLFVHFHPDDPSAGRLLGCPLGKTEAWIVIDVDPALTGDTSGYALVGFNRPVKAAEVEIWVEQQDVPAMVAAMNRLPLTVGDTLLVPAGVAHAIGPGLTLVELQQPTDLSVLLEFAGYGLGPQDAFLGLPRSEALSALTTGMTGPEDLARLQEGPRGGGSTDARLRRLFPDSADPFFRAWRVQAIRGVPVRLPHVFGILVVLSGEGMLHGDASSTPLTRGLTVLLPHGAGPLTISGDVCALLCAPPDPALDLL